MYQQHFGLSRPPFKITPDTSLFFEGSQRGAALDALMYAIKSGEGIIKVVGEVGSGKTMLCRMLEVRLKNEVDVIYIANPSLSPDNILHVIAHELDLDVSNTTSKVDVMHQIQMHLLEKHSSNRQVVMFVEEAQSMPIETLEEIRLLSNLETDENKLLQMVLFGQPELDEKLALVHIRQLKERITHSFNLSPFPPEDTLQYLNFRLRAVGYTGPDVFSKKTAGVVKKYSNGLTRRINILADKSMLAAYSEGSHLVTAAHIKSAAIDSEFTRTVNTKQMMFAASGFMLVMVAILGGYFMGQYGMNNMQVAANNNVAEVAPISAPVKEIVAPKTVLVNNTVYEKPSGIIARVNNRIEETKSWLNSARDNHYSIQLFMARTSDKNRVESFLQDLPATLDFTKVYIYETVVNGRAWYSVLYNDFTNQDKAIAMLKMLPTSLKASDPYLRRISALKRDVTKMIAQN